MVAKRHKITNVPLFKKIWDIIVFFWDNNFFPHFLKQRDINSYFAFKFTLRCLQPDIVAIINQEEDIIAAMHNRKVFPHADKISIIRRLLIFFFNLRKLPQGKKLQTK
jgi:hypothetical protein